MWDGILLNASRASLVSCRTVGSPVRQLSLRQCLFLHLVARPNPVLGVIAYTFLLKGSTVVLIFAFDFFFYSLFAATILFHMPFQAF